MTVGNALRRILLSSITGAAITSVRIHGVLHEFSTIPGVVEDVTDIILNLKSIPLKLQGDEPRRMTIKKTGPATVTAADIAHDGDIEILDTAIPIASLDIDGTLEVEMVVKNGRGYIPADQNFDEDQSLDYIPLDSSHSPVLKVNYKVEPARVGKRIDYESLTLEIWTTGAIRPIDALSQAAKIMRDHLGIFLNVVDEPLEHEAAPSKKEIPYPAARPTSWPRRSTTWSSRSAPTTASARPASSGSTSSSRRPRTSSSRRRTSAASPLPRSRRPWPT